MRKTKRSKISSIYEVFKLSGDNLTEYFVSLNKLKNRLAKEKNVDQELINSTLRRIKMLRLKSLINGDKEMFDKFKKLEEEFNSLLL